MGAAQQIMVAQKIDAGGGGSITNPGNAIAATLATGTAPTLAFPGAVQSGSLLIAAIQQGDETVSVTSVTDSINGAWTLLDGPFDHPSATLRGTMYYKENSGAGTPTVTFNLSGSIQVRAAIAEFRGALTSGALDELGTPSSFLSSTNPTTNSVNFNGNGAVVSTILTSASITITPATGETNVTNASTRAHLMFEAHTGTGSTTQSATTVSATGITMISSWLAA